MRKTNGDYARVLVGNAEYDWSTAEKGLAIELPLKVVCFHIQQTAEKLLKALLAWRDVEYPLTHDLEKLVRLAAPLVPWLRDFEKTPPNYSVYALAMRYDETYPTREEALAAFETVRRLRALVLEIIPPA